MRKFRQNISYFNRNRSPGYPRHIGRARWLNHHIGADSNLPLFGVVQDAHGKSDDEQNQRDLKRNGNDTDQRPYGPVNQIRDNHSVHHDER